LGCDDSEGLAAVDGETHIIDGGEAGARGFLRKNSSASPVSFPEVPRFQQDFRSSHGICYSPLMWQRRAPYLRTEKGRQIGRK